jgi:hypothetical protein
MLKPSADLAPEKHVSGETCLHLLRSMSNTHPPIPISKLQLIVYLDIIFYENSPYLNTIKS